MSITRDKTEFLHDILPILFPISLITIFLVTLKAVFMNYDHAQSFKEDNYDGNKSNNSVILNALAKGYIHSDQDQSTLDSNKNDAYYIDWDRGNTSLIVLDEDDVVIY